MGLLRLFQCAFLLKSVLDITKLQTEFNLLCFSFNAESNLEVSNGPWLILLSTNLYFKSHIKRSKSSGYGTAILKSQNR
jgi:hypothetical protein